VRENIRAAPTMQEHAQRMLQIYRALADGEPIQALPETGEDKQLRDNAYRRGRQT